MAPNHEPAFRLSPRALLAAVEAAYALEAPPSTWNAALLLALNRALAGRRRDPGAPESWGIACVCELLGSGVVRVDRESMASLAHGEPMLELLLPELEVALGRARERAAERGERTTCCVSIRDSLPLGASLAGEPLPAHAGAGALTLLALGERSRGWLLALPISGRRRLHPSVRHDLERIGAHVLSALRLRSRLDLSAETNPALQRYRPWCNTGLELLSELERRAVDQAARGVHTKQIACSMGLASSTVRVLLMRAARKCGVQDRAELTELWTHAAGERRSDPE